jgi:predicted porin
MDMQTFKLTNQAMRGMLGGALAAACACHGGAAQAQSSVTLYGLIDEGVRYTTHADKAGDSNVTMESGASESHWGLKGTEDLGGGTRAVFQLEDRFFPNTGAIDPAYPLFNTAFVGLQSQQLGQLTLGRQTNPLADAVLRTYISDAWLPSFYQFRPEVSMAEGVWTSNMVKYAAKSHDVTLELSYAFGGQAGSFGAGSQIGASLAYVPQGPLRLAAGYLDARDAVDASAHFKAWTAGAAYTYGSTSFNAGWAMNREDAGFTGNFPNGPFSVAQLTALKFNTFASREMFFAGVTQLLGQATHLSANIWRTLQTGKAASGTGNATQFQLLADYNLSPRTDVYLESDYSLYRGGLVGAQLQGVNALSSAAQPTQLGVMAGIRHAF